MDPALIRESRFAFVVLRDPVERFLSLYFDKIWGDGPQSFPAIRALLVREIGLDPARGLDAAGHRRNCLRLADWLGENLAGRTEAPVNPHWRRQAARLRRARAMAPARLTLEGLDRQLPALLGPAVPELAAAMAAVTARNRAPRPVRSAELVTPELARRIRAHYAEDEANWRRAAEDWAGRLARGWENRDPLRPAPPAGAPVLRLLGCHRFPVHLLPVPGNGETFLRALLHLLDHGRPPPEPADRAAEADTPAFPVAADGHGGRGFLVLADPAARLLALARAAAGGRPDAAPRALRAAAHALLDAAEAGADPRLRPQAAIAAEARPFGLRALLLEDLSRQLEAHLGAVVPEIGAALARLRPLLPEAPPRGFPDAALASRIARVYGPDRDLHRRVAAAWAAEGAAPAV